MKIGAVYPQTEVKHDPSFVRDYAQTIEDLGYTHVLAYDHVLGANPDRPGGWSGTYSYEDPFLEPFVLFAYMASITSTLEFVSGVIILPQRETALVAKQAASLDLLCDGRFRLGVGIGWNEVEYVALKQNFRTRGRRVEEQIALLRELWKNPLVEFSGEWHTIPDAGLNPLPVQRPIPIWIGAHADAAIQRAARLGDGWLPLTGSVSKARRQLDVLFEALSEAGRSREGFGIEPRISYGEGNPDDLSKAIEDWREAGATHLSVNTMRLGFSKPEDHLNAFIQFSKLHNLK